MSPPTPEPHPASWYARVGGKTLNREWVKARFGAAGELKGGEHEWIPSDLIVEVVQRADHASQAKSGPSWVELQHKLRSPTHHVIFKPHRNPQLEADLAKHLQEKGSTPENFITKNKVRTETFGLNGHSGALYLTQNEKKVQQTRGQGQFHDGLRRVFRQNNTDQGVFRKALWAYVEMECWNGRLDFLPEELHDYADKITNTYEGKKGKPWGKTLQAVANKVRDHFAAIQQLINPPK